MLKKKYFYDSRFGLEANVKFFLELKSRNVCLICFYCDKGKLDVPPKRRVWDCK